MFQQQQLSQQSRAFIQNAHTVSPGNSEQLSIAVSRAIAWKLALPTMETIHPGVSYLEMHDDTVRKTLSILNELLIIDITTILDITKQFWSMRYAVAFPSAYAISTEANPMAAILGHGNSLSQDVLDALGKDPASMLTMVNGFTRVLADLGACNAPVTQG